MNYKGSTFCGKVKGFPENSSGNDTPRPHDPTGKIAAGEG